MLRAERFVIVIHPFDYSLLVSAKFVSACVFVQLIIIVIIAWRFQNK